MSLAGGKHLTKGLLQLIVRRIVRPQGKYAPEVEVRRKARQAIDGVERCMGGRQDVLRRVVDINQDRVVAAPLLVSIEALPHSNQPTTTEQSSAPWSLRPAVEHA
jgi:hypothetical protein